MFLSFASSLFGQDYWLLSSQSATSAIEQKGLVKSIALNSTLLATTLESTTRSQSEKERSLILYFPNEADRLEAFDLTVVPLFSSALAQKYPNIKAYRGKSTTRNGVRSLNA